MIMTALSQFYVLVICFQLVVVGRSWSLWPSKKPLLDSTETSKNIFKQTCTERLVYLDLGANWANTLRLYKDYDFCVNNRSDWEIYGFEAMPLIIPFAENFVKFLNGHARRPHLDLPPLTSEHELWHFASKHDCHLVPPVTNEKKCHAGCKQCMAEKLKSKLYDLKVDDWLSDRALLTDRLSIAANRNIEHRPRYTLLPAAASSFDGMVNITTNRIGLLHGGGRLQHHQHNGKKGGGSQWDHPETFAVPSVDVAQWIERHFEEKDFLFVKINIEGAEFAVIERMAELEILCHIDVLLLECHAGLESPGKLIRTTTDAERRCKRLKKQIRHECPNMVLDEARGIDKATSREIYKQFVLDI